MYEACVVEELGNYCLENEKVIWKGREYVFPNYFIDCTDYVMLDENDKEIGRISCKSGIVVVLEIDNGFKILEAVDIGEELF